MKKLFATLLALTLVLCAVCGAAEGIKLGIVTPDADHGFTGESVAHARAEAEAMKAAGSVKAEDIKAALGGVTYTGVSGDIAFDSQGDAIRDTAYIKTANNAEGTWTLEKVQTGSGN